MLLASVIDIAWLPPVRGVLLILLDLCCQAVGISMRGGTKILSMTTRMLHMDTWREPEIQAIRHRLFCTLINSYQPFLDTLKLQVVISSAAAAPSRLAGEERSAECWNRKETHEHTSCDPVLLDKCKGTSEK